MPAQKKHYDLEKKNKAVTGFGLRALVAGYLIYLGAQILKAAAKGESPIPLTAVIAIFVVFLAAALGFVYYAWRQYQVALHAAECTEEEMQAELDAAAQAEQNGEAQAANAQPQLSKAQENDPPYHEN